EDRLNSPAHATRHDKDGRAGRYALTQQCQRICLCRVNATFVESAVNQGGHGQDRRIYLQAIRWQVKLELCLNFQKNIQGRKRVTAQLDEIVVIADPVETQHLLPDLSQLSLS